MTIIDTELYDYGSRLSVKMSDGRVLKFTAATLVEQAPSADALRVETLERDRDELIRQLTTIQ